MINGTNMNGGQLFTLFLSMMDRKFFVLFLFLLNQILLKKIKIEINLFNLILKNNI